MRKILLILALSVRILEQSPSKSYLGFLSRQSREHFLYLAVPVLKNNTDVFVVTTNYELREFYRKGNFTNKSYQDFLQEIFERQIRINIKDLGAQTVDLINQNSNIHDYYKKNGLQSTIHKYLKPKGGTLVNRPHDWESINALIQIMFDNNYVVSFSDYTGYYYFAPYQKFEKNR